MGKPIAATYESYDSPGYFAAVRARAVVDVPPDALYELLAVSMAKLAPSSVEVSCVWLSSCQAFAKRPARPSTLLMPTF